MNFRLVVFFVYLNKVMQEENVPFHEEENKNPDISSICHKNHKTINKTGDSHYLFLFLLCITLICHIVHKIPSTYLSFVTTPHVVNIMVAIADFPPKQQKRKIYPPLKFRRTRANFFQSENNYGTGNRIPRVNVPFNSMNWKRASFPSFSA